MRIISRRWFAISAVRSFEKSFLVYADLSTCAQIEKYADLYTSRVSNFLRYTPFMYFRSSQLALAHNPKVRYTRIGCFDVIALYLFALYELPAGPPTHPPQGQEHHAFDALLPVRFISSRPALANNSMVRHTCKWWLAAVS